MAATTCIAVTMATYPPPASSPPRVCSLGLPLLLGGSFRFLLRLFDRPCLGTFRPSVAHPVFPLRLISGMLWSTSCHITSQSLLTYEEVRAKYRQDDEREKVGEQLKSGRAKITAVREAEIAAKEQLSSSVVCTVAAPHESCHVHYALQSLRFENSVFFNCLLIGTVTSIVSVVEITSQLCFEVLLHVFAPLRFCSAELM